MKQDPFNPLFKEKVLLKRELRELKRRKEELEHEVSRKKRAADELIAHAQEEARIIVKHAYLAPREDVVPISSIAGEVAAAFGIPQRYLRERGGTPAVRRARLEALQRALVARPDLNDADLARFFGGIDQRTVSSARKQLGNG